MTGTEDIELAFISLCTLFIYWIDRRIDTKFNAGIVTVRFEILFSLNIAISAESALSRHLPRPMHAAWYSLLNCGSTINSIIIC